MTPVPSGATADSTAKPVADTAQTELLAGIAVPLLRASTASQQAVVLTVLARLAEYCGADRASLYQTRSDAANMAVTHSWATNPTNVVANGESATAGGIGPQWLAALGRGETIVSDPVEWELEPVPGQPVPARGVVLAPMVVDGSLLGIARVDATGDGASLHACAPTVQLVADMLAASLLRAAEVAEVEHNEQEYLKLLDSTGVVVVRMNAEGRIAYVNQFLSEMVDIPMTDLLGSDGLRFVHPDDRVIAAEHLAALADGDDSQVREIRMMRYDGTERWMEVHVKLMEDEAGNPDGSIGILHDITERRQGELNSNAATVRAELAAARAEKSSLAKSEFLSRMSHELRTPLNAILGFGQLLEFSGLSGEDADNLERIIRAGRHLLDLIDDALDVARIETGRLSMSIDPVQLGPVTLESLDLVRPIAAERSVNLNPLPADYANRHVLADRQRFKQVLVNLLSNAVKYNQPGGQVSIECTRLTKGEAIAGRFSEHGWLRIAVSDTGKGIPAERLEDVFLPFERAGAEQTDVEGSGLGLALTKSLVEAMNGRIGVYSVQGVGATFYVDLPAAEASAVEEPDQATPSAPAPVYEHSVIYVEDNPSNLTLVRRVLARRPQIELTVATDGVSGLAAIREHKPEMVLLDVHLPLMDGHDVLAAIRADADPRIRDIVVVVLTADLTPSTEKRLMAAGASAFLSKPIDVHQLLEAVDRYLGAKSNA